MTILIFWTKFARRGDLPPQTTKRKPVKTTIKFHILALDFVQNFSFNRQF